MRIKRSDNLGSYRLEINYWFFQSQKAQAARDLALVVGNFAEKRKGFFYKKTTFTGSLHKVQTLALMMLCVE